MITRKTVVTMISLAFLVCLVTRDAFAVWGNNDEQQKRGRWGHRGGMHGHPGGRGGEEHHGMHGHGRGGGHRGGPRHYKLRGGKKYGGHGQLAILKAPDCPGGIKIFQNNNGTLQPATGASILSVLQANNFEVEGSCTDSGGAATPAPAATPAGAGGGAAPAAQGDEGDESDSTDATASGSTDGSTTTSAAGSTAS